MKGTLRGTFFFGEALGRRRTEVTILMPCLNEAATVGNCVAKARGFLARAQITGEVLVADNGSRDGSRAVAEQAGARVVDVAERGYGAALAGGIAAARGRYVIMGDADDSYDFGRLEGFVARLREGYPLVMGNRFQGSIGKGAMPLLHRYLGNPVLSFVGACCSARRSATSIAACAALTATPSGLSTWGPGGWSSRASWWSRPRSRDGGLPKFPPRCRRMAADGRRICAAGATAGATCASSCSSASAGCSCIRGSPCWRSASR